MNSIFAYFFAYVGAGFALAIGFQGFEALVYIIQSSAVWFFSRFKKDRP
ncbi:hypothetical protein [uncultured Oscillibacter sp.]|nr:hypothetical protein [uncultured Oscillibacter sp.]